MTTLRSRLLVLLEHYRDVLEGVRDRGSHCSRDGCKLSPRDRWLCERHGCADDGVLALMHQAWNHPSYQMLETLLVVMRAVEPGLYRHLTRKYLDYTEVRRAYCRKCGHHPPSSTGRVHKHPPGRSITLTPVVIRRMPSDVDERRVMHALDWLVGHWPTAKNTCDIPEDVHAIERERALREKP